MCGSYYSVHSAAHVEWLRPGVRQTLMLLLLLLVLLVGIPAANGEPLPFSLTPGTMQQQQHQQQLAVCFTRMNGIQNQFDLCSNAYVCPPYLCCTVLARVYRRGALIASALCAALCWSTACARIHQQYFNDSICPHLTGGHHTFTDTDSQCKLFEQQNGKLLELRTTERRTQQSRCEWVWVCWAARNRQ